MLFVFWFYTQKSFQLCLVIKYCYIILKLSKKESNLAQLLVTLT